MDDLILPTFIKARTVFKYLTPSSADRTLIFKPTEALQRLKLELERIALEIKILESLVESNSAEFRTKRFQHDVEDYYKLTFGPSGSETLRVELDGINNYVYLDRFAIDSYNTRLLYLLALDNMSYIWMRPADIPSFMSIRPLSYEDEQRPYVLDVFMSHSIYLMSNETIVLKSKNLQFLAPRLDDIFLCTLNPDFICYALCKDSRGYLYLC